MGINFSTVNHIKKKLNSPHLSSYIYCLENNQDEVFLRDFYLLEVCWNLSTVKGWYMKCLACMELKVLIAARQACQGWCPPYTCCVQRRAGERSRAQSSSWAQQPQNDKEFFIPGEIKKGPRKSVPWTSGG